MPRYQFVLKETPIGQADHGNHLHRRAIAVAKAQVLGVVLAQPMPPPDYGIPESQIAGDWCYTWVVDAPDILTVWALIKEFTLWGNVGLYSGPTPVFSVGELLLIRKLSVKLRDAFPKE
jgi:hypothetical protein